MKKIVLILVLGLIAIALPFAIQLARQRQSIINRAGFPRDTRTLDDLSGTDDAVPYEDLDESTVPPVLQELNETYGIEEIEQVFNE